MRSDAVKKGFEKAPHRALLRAVGLKEEDFKKPFVAVVNSYVDIVPGHVHLQALGKNLAAKMPDGLPALFPSSSTLLPSMTASPWGTRNEIQPSIPGTHCGLRRDYDRSASIDGMVCIPIAIKLCPA